MKSVFNRCYVEKCCVSFVIISVTFYPEVKGENIQFSLLSYRIIVPPRKQSGDFGPAISQNAMGFADEKVFYSSPGLFIYRRVQMIVPAFSALLPPATL